MRSIAVISAPVFTRLLLPEEQGYSSIFLTWVNVLSIIFSLYPQGSLATAIRDFEGEEYENYVSSVISLSAISFLLFSIIFIVINNYISIFSYNNLSIILVITAFSHFLFNFLQVKLVYEVKLMKNVIVSFVFSLLTVVASIFFIQLYPQNKGLGKIIGDSLPSIIIGIILFVYFIKPKSLYNSKYWLYSLRLSLPMILNTFAVTMIAQTGQIMLDKTWGAYFVGIYAINFSVGDMSNIIRQGFTQTWLPWYFHAYDEGKAVEIKTMSSIFTRIVFILFAGFILLVPEVAKLLLHSKYWDGIVIVPFIVSAVFINFLSSFYSAHVIYLKKNYIVSIATVISLLVNVLFNIIFISKFGYYSAAVSLVIAFIAMNIFYFLYFRQIKVKLDIDKREMKISFVMLVVILVVQYLFIDIWLIRWAIGVGLGIYLLYYSNKNKNKILNVKIN